jgi:hypothetical protein
MTGDTGLLREIWDLSAGVSAWLTIAVQIGFVCGAIVSSLLNLPDIVAPGHVTLGGAIGAAVTNALVQIAGGPVVGIPLRFAKVRTPFLRRSLTLARSGGSLATLGYVGHMWELFALCAWFYAFFGDALAWGLGSSGRLERSLYLACLPG